MKKTYYLFALLLITFNQSFSQAKHKSAVSNDLPQYVIADFGRAVNYSWYYANNKDAFRAALIPGLQHHGLTNIFNIERTIQDVGKRKSCRDLILVIMSNDRTMSQLVFFTLLKSIGIPPNSANILSSYVYEQVGNDVGQIGDLLPAKRNYITIGENVELKKFPKSNWSWPSDYYCLYGTRVVAVKQNDEFLYCETINLKTKKVIKGWIDSALLQPDDTNIATRASSNITSKYAPLMHYDGLGINQEDDNGISFLNNPVTLSELNRLLANYYSDFERNINGCIGSVEIKNRVIYGSFSTFNPHIIGFISIDVLNQKSYLCLEQESSYDKWNTKYYGDDTLGDNVITMIRRKISEDEDTEQRSTFDEDRTKAAREMELLKRFLVKYNQAN